MPQKLKRLGQVSPGAAVNANLYTPAAGTQFVCSSIVVANTEAVDKTIRVHAVRGAEAAAQGNAISYDVPLGPNDILTLQLGICGNGDDGDKIVVQASAANVSFTAFGQEIS